ncbi:MAG: tRNA uridine-5-carboxymethylaminomethyl(34) synthesis GTPase MnmE [Devosiaceae bacterium]|nr:tRNA uridine-5-carboxymethylaminomethyl(34) synthesis GTPase MnmE [Devosiaceae bacterium]
MAQIDTIVALSSGSLPSGVAIIRISGSKVRDIANKLINGLPQARTLTLKTIKHGQNTIDQALIAYFAAPHSFTGHDCLEFHVHGSKAVVQKLLNILISFENVRLAEAGEFTRQAFENGKIDLVEAEGLADLLDSETENQRVQALARASGEISNKIELWRQQLLSLRASLEAHLDFSDEEDVLEALPSSFIVELQQLSVDFTKAIKNFEQGRIIRDGFRVAIAGPVNAGKSSLINRLVKSELAIVSEEAGTTRDIREVEMDIDGNLVIFIDMAGFRETSSIAEIEGIRRAREEISQADVLLWLDPFDGTDNLKAPDIAPTTISIGTKSDLGEHRNDSTLNISSKSGEGIEQLIELIKQQILFKTPISNDSVILSRLRDKEALNQALEETEIAIANLEQPEIAASALLRASTSLARLLGKIDPEHILGEIFSKLCIGK